MILTPSRIPVPKTDALFLNPYRFTVNCARSPGDIMTLPEFPSSRYAVVADGDGVCVRFQRGGEGTRDGSIGLASKTREFE